MSNLLEDHIDAPIKKAVAGLALLGFNPIMSCCGFSYDNEAVPKTHLKKAYVYLSWSAAISKIPYEAFSTALMTLSQVSDWTIAPVKGFSDGLIVFDFYGNTWSSGHPWKRKEAVHNYEVFVLAITSLNKVIEKYEDIMLDLILLEDGNKHYEKLSKFWKYKSTEPWLITKEIWKNLPS